MIPHLATNFIRQGCDRYIINEYHSIEDVGLFSFALNLATIISMIGIGFNQSNSVDIYKVLGGNSMANEAKMNRLQKQRQIIRTVYILIAVVVIIGCYFLIPLISPKYAGCKGYIPILSIYAFFLCLYYLYTNYLFYYNKTKNIMYVTLSSAVLHLGLSLLFTRYSLYMTWVVYCLIQLMVVIVIKHLAMKELKSKLV